MQNLALSGVSAWQCGQRMDGLSGMAVRAARGASGQKPWHLSLIRANGMVCHYPRPAQVSSGKRNRALDPGAADGGGDASDIATGTVIVGRSRAPSESLTVIARRAHATHVWRSRTCGR